MAKAVPVLEPLVPTSISMTGSLGPALGGGEQRLLAGAGGGLPERS